MDAGTVAVRRIEAFVDAGLFVEDPTAWVCGSGEPYARWAALTGILGRASDDTAVAHAHLAVVANEGVCSLVAELPEWGRTDRAPRSAGGRASASTAGGHHSPAFLPNRLNLLADMGVRAGDFAEIETLLDRMLEHQDKSGRFEAFAQLSRPKPEWGSLLCDTAAITDVLLRFGRGDDMRVGKALKRMASDAAPTPQGRAWQCLPEHRTLFRGPGRKADVCPQVTLEALRAFSHLPTEERPTWILDAARVPLEIWRRRTEERPYAFGHGFQFKSVKWPNFWYDVLWVLETAGRFPEMWRGPDARDEDRVALAELAACLVEYNFNDLGRLTPRRVYRGFSTFSFGQKKRPSPFATARALIALARLADLADDVARVEVTELPSSKGGSGVPVPPRARTTTECPLPARQRYPLERALPRVLTRQHLTAVWEVANVESVVSDIVALHAAEPTTPHLSLHARLPSFQKTQLQSALWDRRSLVLYRGMRGMLYVVRREMLPVVHAATNRAVVRYAREFARGRGVTPEEYERLAPAILDATAGEPMTTKELRAVIDTKTDVAATVTLMSAEGLLLRARPAGDWRDRRYRWTPLAVAVPEVRLDALDERSAGARLLSSYVRAFGPVTVRDAAWWTGMDPKRARRAVEALEGELVEVELGDSDEPYLMHASDVEELAWATTLESPSVALLPPRDPLIMGYGERARFVDEELRPFVFDVRANVTSVVLVDGRVAGLWDIGDIQEPVVSVWLPERLDSGAREAVDDQAAQVGEFYFERPVPVRHVADVQPLTERAPSALLRPIG